MMRLSCLYIIALCLILLPCIVVAQQSAGDSKMDATSRIFEQIPIEGKLNETAEEVHAQLSQNPFGLPPGRNERMVSLFEQAFTKDSLLADAQRAFRQQYEPALADSALQWISSDSARQVLETEQEFYTLQGLRKRVVKKYELAQDPPSQNRIDLIQSVAGSMSAGELEMEAQSIIYRAIISAFGELNEQQSFTEDQIDQIVSNYRSQIRPQVEQSVTDQLLFKYYGLENDVLKKYGAFYETAPGTWLISTTSGSMHAAYQAAADRFLESVRNL